MNPLFKGWIWNAGKEIKARAFIRGNTAYKTQNCKTDVWFVAFSSLPVSSSVVLTAVFHHTYTILGAHSVSCSVGFSTVADGLRE